MVKLLFATVLWLAPAAHALSGSIIIAGDGPELPTIERLGRAFEKGHPGSVVEIRWDPSSRPIELVKSGEAFFAVTGRESPDLASVPFGWDGIAVIVDSTNPVKEITGQQLADIFSGRITRWSEVGGPDLGIQLIDRPQYKHIRQSFEETLGIVGQIPKATTVIRSDQKAISTVAGSLAAITYASLGVAMEAVRYGVNVNLLMIDRVEAAKQTVKDGRYALRRPLLLLSRKEQNQVAEAFAAFARSQEGQAIVDEIFVPYAPSAR